MLQRPFYQISLTNWLPTKTTRSHLVKEICASRIQTHKQVDSYVYVHIHKQLRTPVVKLTSAFYLDRVPFGPEANGLQQPGNGNMAMAMWQQLHLKGWKVFGNASIGRWHCALDANILATLNETRGRGLECTTLEAGCQNRCVERLTVAFEGLNEILCKDLR